MNVEAWLVWGFVSTLVLTTLLSASQGMRFTRINLPYMLGTLITPDRDRARVIGIGLHVVNGWLFTLVYVAIFHAAHLANWWFGGLIGLAHAAFVLMVLMPVLPGLHPRMAAPARGPTIARQLEPPGFLALHYGARTPVSVVLAHMIFGIVFGALYSLH